MTSAFTGGLKSWDDVAAKTSTSSISDVKLTDATSQPTKKKATTLDVLSAEYGPLPIKSALSLDEKCKRALSVAEECTLPEELKELFATKEAPICYDGFEPSGRMHIAQGIMKALTVNALTSCGCVFVFWVADWFALLNNKLGGDLEKIRVVGQYFVEVWKAVGMDMRNVRFLWASDEINKNSEAYWTRVMDIARKNSITRLKRCCQIMGRADGDDQPAANILYPCMQCSDIFYLRADICQLGMDQRKVNMLAREYAEQLKMKKKPIILSHRMLPGLLEGQEKMSKSNADSAIFMEDSAQDVNRKIKQAFCPPQKLEGNPCIAYVDALIFPYFGKFQVDRSEQNGGSVVFDSMDDFRAAYVSGALHPGDLKPNLSKHINAMLEPVRQHFAKSPEARALLARIRKWESTKKK